MIIFELQTAELSPASVITVNWSSLFRASSLVSGIFLRILKHLQ